MASPPLVALCPGKVNLGLRVLGRRDDGYHELETVFQAIDLWDRLEVRPAPGLSLTCDDPALPADESNLVLRAARFLQERYGLEGRGARFRLRKSIPAGGGLGGGSSDAAGAILLLTRLWEIPTSRAELLGLAARLGADVPFFLVGGTALGRGRGDRLTPLPFAGPRCLVLAFPPFRISTREVFELLRERLTPTPNDVSVTPLSSLKLPEGKDFGFLGNDLEEVVFERWPDLGTVKGALLDRGARGAQLSGSGSTVFGVFDEPGPGREAAGKLGTAFRGWAFRLSRTIRDGVSVLPGPVDVR